MFERHLPDVPEREDPGRLNAAMRYALLGGGKRLRPLLALAAAEAIGAPVTDSVRLAAAAVELVHCYSLVHDDLPAMDDDDYRRGRPSTHKAYGEAVGILVGDALLTLAFEWLAKAGALAESETNRPSGPLGSTAPSHPKADLLRAVFALARAAGPSGMVRGQARDVGEPAPADMNALEVLHSEKTGALFVGAVQVGALAAGVGPAELAALTKFASAYGVAFQHADDADDGEHPELAEAAQARLRALVESARGALSSFGPSAEPLRLLAAALIVVK